MSVYAFPVRGRDLRERLNEAIDGAVEWLVQNQAPEGYWVGRLESNSCMEAEWILALHFLGVQDEDKFQRLAKAILNEQRPDGSWGIYYGAPDGDINTTVECYAALRAVGMDPQSGELRSARQWILRNGALNHLRVFTKFWLALIGEWSWEAVPTLPPELIFLPSWFPINIYSFASWARATLLPLSILSARRPVRPLPEGRRLDELFPQGRAAASPPMKPSSRGLTWERIFFAVDRLLSRYVSFPWRPGRETAIRLCTEWIIRHQEADGAWGGIQPPWVYSLMALHVEGYPLDHPVMAKGIGAIDAPHWKYERDGGTYVQACNSPVWDTVLSLLALLDCDLDAERCPAIVKAVQWVLDQQVFAPGDWQVKARGVEPGGWAFEFANRNYPDTDDTAVALLVLARARRFLRDSERIETAIRRGERWLVGLQCADGGWGAFDKDNMNLIVTKIPFCDFGEVLDPPSVDLTGHAVEALAHLGRSMKDPVVVRALRYIRKEQEPDGSWFGRWGVNYLYGTGAVLPALRAIGEDMTSEYVLRAARWLVSHQNPDGGWGETPASYMEESLRGVGESTPSQTAWALMGLLALGVHDFDDAVERGVRFLLDRQQDGTWNEPQYTGTGFPGYGHGSRSVLDQSGTLDQGTELARGFMINYNLYRHYFPLMALGRAKRHFQSGS